VLDLAHLLDDYSAGRFDQAMGAVASAGDVEANQLRTEWRTTGRVWIDAVPSAKPQRLLAAAAFALETEHLAVERGRWAALLPNVCPLPPNSKNKDAKAPAGLCVIQWAWQLLVERTVPDAAERAWVLAASALLEGVREFPVLYTAMPGAMIPERGLLAEALVRHPGDARLRLEQAIAVASRYNVTTAGGGVALDFVSIINNGRGGMPVNTRARVNPKEAALSAMRALVDDPEVGAEARLRLGYVLWATGDVEGGRAEFAEAARAAHDRDLKYLARFLSGWTVLQTKPDEARIDLAIALEIRPDSQSASLALAALELQRGEAARADELVKASLAKRPDDVDPWREFLYGHYPRLGRLIADLRREVSR